MFDALRHKLELYTRLSRDEHAALDQALSGRVRKFAPRRNVIHEGDPPVHAYFVMSGWACRYKILEDGRRQTMAYFLDGDLCDLSLFRQIDHSIETITTARIAEVPREAMTMLAQRHPRIASAFHWSALVGEAISREWIVSLGQRTAPERLAHLFCEIFIRCRCVGLVRERSCPMPLTQTELAGAVGLSTVHVNRTLQDLRSSELIILADKRLTVPDFERLQEFAFFNPAYLHIERDGRHLDANDVEATELAL